MSANPDRSGGLNWHLRAFGRRKVLWQPFRAVLAQFLDQWQPDTSHLILVGPSAGWCLPDGWLNRFHHITAIDPDPWAPFLFRRLHPKARLDEWVKGDVFALAPTLLAQHPQAAILFCNLLGQLIFTGLTAAEVTNRLSALKQDLAARPWASFHEIMSSETTLAPSALALDQAVAQRAILEQMGLSGEWLDHEAGGVLPADRPRLIAPWRFAPSRLHLVEMGIGGP